MGTDGVLILFSYANGLFPIQIPAPRVYRSMSGLASA